MIYDRAMHEARKHWRERLGSMSFGGHLPLDHPRPRDGQPRRSSLERPFPEDVHALLRRLTSGNPFLSFTACVLGLRICCARYSGERNVTLFTPAMSGSAPNLLPIGGEVDAGASLKLKDALLATRELLAGAYRFQQYPWSRMLLDVPDDRRPKQLPLIASMAGFHGELPDAPFDLAVRFESGDGGTRASFELDARVHEVVTVERFFQAFCDVLRSGLDEVAGRAGEPPAVATSPGGECAPLHQLIEAHASKHPDRAAVIQDGRVTTYAALERQAAQLAGSLKPLGLDLRKPIALLMDAGAEQIAGMLAALKIGGAFTAIKLLSTRGPIARLLEAVDAECVLAQPAYLADLERGGGGLGRVRHVITVQAGDGGSPAPSPSSGTSGGTACVIADEREGGVTCTPVSHTDLSRVFQWLNAHGGVGPEDRCLLSPGLGACQQLYDTLGLLAAGGSVEIAGTASVRDTALLAKRLVAPEITVWDLPTPLMQNLLADVLALRARRPELKGPRAILLSGEKQCARLGERLARCFPDARITGLYAPAELGIWTTSFPLGHEPAAIACAIPGFEHRVLNKRGEPALPFTKGELRLVSPGSAREVTTGLRVQPLGGGRLRWLRGAEHCFDQHGFRVELTGVETALCEHEHILAAEVVAVRPEPAAETLVAAFIVAEPDRVSAEAARDLLVNRPGVDLVPDRFHVMDELPLAADGAIDREALIKRFVTSRELGNGRERAAAGEIHAQLKQIWLEILQVDDVGEDDSFFASGGNSLKATLLLARIQDDFAVDLSVQQFFREPSTRAVAQLIAAESKSAANRPKAPDFKIVPRDGYRIQLPE